MFVCLAYRDYNENIDYFCLIVYDYYGLNRELCTRINAVVIIIVNETDAES